MDKNGIGSKTLYSNTKEGITTSIEITYNSKTNHIVFKKVHFQKSFISGIVNNKNSSNYLGVTVAERVLSKVFKKVEVMSPHNRGYDIICNQGYKIDIKASTKRKDSKRWVYLIKQNQIADYFLCLAFDDRKNLNPMHIWLISSKEINHLQFLGISEFKLDKWSKYELTDKLDKVITCCNIMRDT